MLFLRPGLCFFRLRFLLSMLRELSHFALQFFVQSSGKCFQILVDFVTAIDQLLQLGLNGLCVAVAVGEDWVDPVQDDEGSASFDLHLAALIEAEDHGSRDSLVDCRDDLVEVLQRDALCGIDHLASKAAIAMAFLIPDLPLTPMR